MPQRLSIPLLKFMYLISRNRTKRCKVAVCRGGKVSEEEWGREDLQEFIKKDK